MSLEADELLGALTLEEKVSLVTGRDMWRSHGIARFGIPSIKVTDGPNGARGDGLLGTGTPTACIPNGAALGASWDPALVHELGQLLGDEARAKNAHVLLAPTINLHRSPNGGRNFECFSEDPILSGQLAAAFVQGVQSRGVATTPKHFVGNDSEFERNSIDSQIDERTLRELYLVPFEHAVKRGKCWGIMAAYNRLNGEFCTENYWLLTKILREEWGFDGFVVTDWFGARSTSKMANAGLSLEMPGPGKFYGDKLLAAVKAGEVSQTTLDSIAKDILKLIEITADNTQSTDLDEVTLDRPEDRVLIRRATAASSVLLHNNGILPLTANPKPTESIFKVAVIGPNARNAKIMGGGSAKVNAYRSVSPYAALKAKLPNAEVRWEQGCNIDRTCSALSKPLVQGLVDVAYFEGHEIDADSDVIATEQHESFDFTIFGQPAPNVSANAFTMRATATVMPKATGPYELRLVQYGRTRILVGGQIVLDATEGDYLVGSAFFGFGTEEIGASLDLVAGRAIELTVEFTNRDTAIFSGVKVGLVAAEFEDLMVRAESLAATSDLAIVVVGTNDEWETEGQDRESWELPGEQRELIRQISKVNERTIVILNVGAPHDLSWLKEPAAVLYVGFGGQELGNALVDMLFGETEPSGRMPTTIGTQYEHFGAYLNYPGENSVVRYGEGLFIGHRFHDALDLEPAVEFGFGLSYTTFEMSPPRLLGEPQKSPGDTVEVEVDVTNCGDRVGSEVVQIYVEPVNPKIRRPLRELKAFKKMTLDPGTSTTVCFALVPRDFAYYDVADQFWHDLPKAGPVPAQTQHQHRKVAGWYLDPGEYRIMCGRSCRDFTGATTVMFVGNELHIN